MNEQKPTIVVAVSGGVDSSVVAAMLTKSGYPVIGVMMHLWSEEGKECENKCCTPQAMDDARQSAQTLGFPFYTIDAADIFKRELSNISWMDMQQEKHPIHVSFATVKLNGDFY